MKVECIMENITNSTGWIISHSYD